MFLGSSSVQFPIDLYRILSIPPRSDAELIQQAYEDRLAQLPQQEFSEAAITIRNEIITDAYNHLQDPEKRQSYDDTWWGGETSSDSEPVYEAEQEQLIGILLIWLELAEYEQLLAWAEPALQQAQTDSSSTDLISDAPDTIESDVVDLQLCVVLAHWELSREYWQQQRYEAAATASLKALGKVPPLPEFNPLETEIRQEYYKLRPYRIQGILGEDHAAEPTTPRHQGITLLKELIDDRQGIEGSGQDFSGLGNDDFLKFIYQLRPYLTVDEQITLFLSESKRPSIVASYLAIHSLILKGIGDRNPQSIIEAQLIAESTPKKQDLMLEIAVCDLLLGQTETAVDKVQRFSLFSEAIGYNEHSPQEIDADAVFSLELLNQFYLATQDWLERDLASQYLDLDEETLSLEGYFNDPEVQAILEARLTADSVPYTTATKTNFLDSDLSALPTQEVIDPMAHSSAVYHEEHPTPSKPRRRRRSASGRSGNQTLPAEQLVATSPAQRSSDYTSAYGESTMSNGNGLALNGLSSHSTTYDTGTTTLPPQKKRVKKRKRYTIKPVRFSLFLLTLFAILGGASWLIGRQLTAPITNLEAEQLDISIDDAPNPLIPDTDIAQSLLRSDPIFTQAVAKQTIEAWLESKEAAFGAKHNITPLNQVLMPNQLQTQLRRVDRDKARREYQQFSYKEVDILEYVVDPANANQAEVIARVQETRQAFQQGSNQSIGSPQVDNLIVRYSMIRDKDLWKIQTIQLAN